MRIIFSCLLLVLCAAELTAAETAFLRGVNLNGPALTIDGHEWLGDGAPGVVIKGSAFENQEVPLKPPTDAARATMLRSSVWGKKVQVELSEVPEGAYQLFVYVWEDNQSERFDILVNQRRVLEGFNSGNAGTWKKLGPFQCESIDSKLTISAQGGDANFSGIEVWRGSGPIPDNKPLLFATAPTTEQLAFFENKIRPVLVERCYECHSVKAEKIKGGLLLDSRAGLLKGGDTGAAITPGDPSASLLIGAVRHTDKELAMPPRKKLPAEQIAALEEWVKMGAPDPRGEDTVAAVPAKNAINWEKAREWWSLRPLVSPEPPQVRDQTWPANEIDRFILARIEQAELKPAGNAGMRAFIRRATYDLIGLPPAPGEVEAFVVEASGHEDLAISHLIDRLLASPQYGERWGRYWLDVVRYADTAGDNSDFPIPQMHRYRDWVIAAFNRDLPYDEFTRMQIAGDLMPGLNEAETRERLIATGYLANARRFGSRVDDYPQHLTIEDTIDNLGRAFLGLTVNCARCHDHKFDPISTRDYYALYGIFNSTRYPWPGIELEQKQRDLIPLASPETVAVFQKEKAEKQMARDAEVKRLEKELKEAQNDAKKPLEDQLKKAKEAAQILPPYEMAYAVAEAAKREDAPVQQKGDPAKPGPIEKRHFLTVFGGAGLAPEEKSSGRLQLAEWILSNPLPARVMANRIWLHHFGKGLVPTPNDFGKQGKPPTHPELLDWLASRLVSEGWSIKQMHRIIMLSHTYRLAGARDAEALERDPNNELLAAFPRLRLDAEALRDTLLALGGTLDPAPGGAHPFPPQTEWKFTQHNPFKAVYETNKRSVYLMTQRIQRHPYLAIFDGADPSVSTPQRAASTTPLQALYLLNDPLVHEQSRRFATRLLAEGNDDEARLQLAYALAFARPADASELEQALGFLTTARARLSATGTADSKLDAEAWQALVRVLFRLNEFVYLE
ncbi:MAG: Planctomycete cytochrome [Chthoniobacteraceae bacterium]|nr:Planctomycete cytochrome [Chthoniobacteraceae bacterium]